MRYDRERHFPAKDPGMGARQLGSERRPALIRGTRALLDSVSLSVGFAILGALLPIGRNWHSADSGNQTVVDAARDVCWTPRRHGSAAAPRCAVDTRLPLGVRGRHDA